MQAALRARLTGAAAVAAIVATRVYWVQRTQGAALPAIVLQTVSDARPQHLKGFLKPRATRVQVDSLAEDYATARRLNEAAIAALVPENISNGIVFNRAMVDGSRDLGERVGDNFIHRISTDLILWWSEEE